MKETSLLPQELIRQKIYFIRGEKVMFDRDLAMLYGVTTKRLNEQVRRNLKRFPSDFMFRLNRQEVEVWKSQIASVLLRSQIATSKRGGLRYSPYVFTEQGVAMLSSVLNSEKAILVNIQIIRVFTQLRKILATQKDLQKKIEAMERRIAGGENKNSKYFKAIFDTLKLLMKEDNIPKEKIGFMSGKK